MELSIGYPDMESEIDKMATTFLDLIGLQSSKTTATSNINYFNKILLVVWF
jgi:hypothetical protein